MITRLQSTATEKLSKEERSKHIWIFLEMGNIIDFICELGTVWNWSRKDQVGVGEIGMKEKVQ